MNEIRNILIFLDMILKCIIESDVALKGFCAILLLLVILIAYRRRIKYPKRKISLNYSPLYGESGSKSQSYCV